MTEPNLNIVVRHRPKLGIWLAKDGFRWRLIGRNGRIVAEGGEAYVGRRNAIRAAKRVVQLMQEAVIV